MAMSLTAILSTACYYEKKDGEREMAKRMARGDGKKETVMGRWQ